MSVDRIEPIISPSLSHSFSLTISRSSHSFVSQQANFRSTRDLSPHHRRGAKISFFQKMGQLLTLPALLTIACDSHRCMMTLQSFAIALGYLYASTSINLVSPTNARSVLATACILGGMDELSAYAYELCKNSMSVESIDDWLDFLQTLPSPPSTSGSGTVSPTGVATPSLPPLPSNPHELHHLAQFGVGPPPTNGVSPPSWSSSVFGPYGPRLRDDVFQFLVSTLPEQLTAANPGNPVAMTNALTEVYVRLPFEYFKAAVESPDFPIGVYTNCLAP
jgi:hypothetical protein